MHIVGGFYRERCYVPEWNVTLGSGGRAALAVSMLSPGSSLHTYAEDFDSEEVASLKELGIEMRLYSRPTTIAFEYFHPLSRPHIQPLLSKIEPHPKIKVHGDAILRFGFLEGDAVVNARRAVYDPQTWRNPAPFGANGSVADELAIVLNEIELRSASGCHDLKQAAFLLMEQQQAVVIVAKRGIRGATVFERSGRIFSVPAYRSSRVFKIGTGDVFSAIFAYHWAEKKWSAQDAAVEASRSVAAYCNSGQLPLSSNALRDLFPIRFAEPCSVLLEGKVNSLGHRYAMEEARFVLGELGVCVVCPSLDRTLNPTANAMLLLAEGLDDSCIKNIRDKYEKIPIVILREGKVSTVDTFVNRNGLSISNDFVSSLYLVAWAAGERDCE